MDDSDESKVAIYNRPVTRAYSTCLTLLLVMILVGCGPDDPLRVETIQLGRSVNPDGSVAGHTTRFKPEDTIYVSILSPAAGYGTLGVRWTYAGRLISEPTKEVSYRGPAATPFNIVNSAGFPPGDYSVEVLLNGQTAGKREFRVDK